MAKRAPQGSGTIRQRPDGRWEARYTTGRDPGTGKQMQKSIYGASQKEVSEKLRHILTDQDNGIAVEPSRLTVSQWMDIWTQEYCNHLKPRTRALYVGHISHRIKPALGAVKLQKIKAPQLQAFYNGLQQGDDALAPKTIKNLHGLLHKALQQAVEVGYLRFNPTQGCKLPRVEKAQLKVLDTEQIAAFLEAIKGHPQEVLYTVTLFTGMRQGEALGLTWNCIDFDAGTIHLYRQLQLIAGTYAFQSLKNDKTRTITAANSVMSLLKSHKLQQTEWQLRAGPAWENKDGFVFTDELGHHLARHTVYKRFKALCPTQKRV